MSKFIAALDTETGGLEAKTSDLLTFYMAILDEDYKIIEELDMKLKPDDRLPIAEEGALKVNKIDIRKHLEDAETITYSAGKILLVTFLKKYHKKKGRFNNIRPMGYNLQFDIGFIQEHLLPKEEWNTLLHYSDIDPKKAVDFLKDCTIFPEDIGSLGSLVDYLGIPKRNAHSAKEDTLMMIDSYKSMIALMKSKKQGGSQQDLISLLESE